MLTRRAFLRAGAALGVCALAPVWAAPEPSTLEAFLTLSREATGFADLSPELGARYLSALTVWEPELSSLLGHPPSLQDLSPRQAQLVDLVIEAWYTGVVPTSRGSQSITYLDALGHRCLARESAPTTCLASP